MEGYFVGDIFSYYVAPFKMLQFNQEIAGVVNRLELEKLEAIMVWDEKPIYSAWIQSPAKPNGVGSFEAAATYAWLDYRRKLPLSAPVLERNGKNFSIVCLEYLFSVFEQDRATLKIFQTEVAYSQVNSKETS